MTPQQRFLTALRGEMPDRTPFVVYETKIPQCAAERAMRNRGMLIMHRRNSYSIVHPNVKVREERFFDEQNRWMVRRVYETPAGSLSTLDQPVGFTSWHHEHLFKTPEDYAPLLFMINDARVVTDYDAAAQFIKEKGEDFIVREGLGYEPLQEIIYGYMGSETFCYEWADNRDEIMKLFDALVRLRRETYRAVADGPTLFANYGGNVTPQIIGPKVFRELYLPHYAEAAEVLHSRGKLIGCHLDADNSMIMADVGTSELDYIEAYDPGISPSVSEARKAFGKKALSIHWPSGDVFLPYEKMVERTVGMIREAAPGQGFIIGVTEDPPPALWQSLFNAILDGIDAAHA